MNNNRVGNTVPQTLSLVTHPDQYDSHEVQKRQRVHEAEQIAHRCLLKSNRTPSLADDAYSHQLFTKGLTVPFAFQNNKVRHGYDEGNQYQKERGAALEFETSFRGPSHHAGYQTADGEIKYEHYNHIHQVSDQTYSDTFVLHQMGSFAFTGTCLNFHGLFHGCGLDAYFSTTVAAEAGRFIEFGTTVFTK